MYSAEVRRIYDVCADNARLLNEEYAIQAAVVAERLFPPADAEETLKVLAALNLLNAVVKRRWGRRIVTYEYIKGMAAELMLWLLDNPVDGVKTYWDGEERIAYFSVHGVQISFHYIPLSAALLRRLGEVCQEKQTWTGMQLQKIAVEVFLMAVGQNVDYSKKDERCARQAMKRCQTQGEESAEEWSTADMRKALTAMPETPFREDKAHSLKTALHFRVWDMSVCTLWRRKDRKNVNMARYDGSNYEELMDFLIGEKKRIKRRPRNTLKKGKFYFVSPQKKIRCVCLHNYVQMLTRNSYLRTEKGYCNLCITYGIARYLGMLHPTLKFVCTLNFNHMNEQRIYYSYHEMLRVPLLSQARMLKVWLILDTAHLLDDFDADTLPQALVDDYMESEDYYQEFEVVCDRRGREGVVAYRNFEILNPRYLKIKVFNYHAHVLGENRRWAIFSLCDEKFKSGFVYEEIYYDNRKAQIIGIVEGREKVIHSFPLLPPPNEDLEMGAEAKHGR